jgi:endonuclease/exonuclease/phosphatase family metal-dependent hydrolase
MSRSITARGVILDSLLLLALLSALTGFIEATYTFGLLGTDLPPELLFVLLLLSPVLLLPFSRLLESGAFTVAAGGLGLACWAASLPLGVRPRMIVAGAACALLIPVLAARIRQRRRGPLELGTSLAMAVLASVMLRSLASGSLLLSAGTPLGLGIGCAALGLVLLVLDAAEPVADRGEGRGDVGAGRAIALCAGLACCLLLLYFGFTSPAVIARWDAASLVAVIGVEAGSLLLFLVLPGFRARMTPGLLIIWNVLFTAALAYTLYARQPVYTGSWPLDAPSPGALGSVSFWAMIVLHPVIYADFALIAGSLHAGRPSPRALAAGFSVAALLILAASFAQIFTTVYDYIPVIGPWFRDKFWLVMSAPAALLLLSILFLGRDAYVTPEAAGLPAAWIAVAVLLGGGAILATELTAARPPAAAAGATLRVLQYNIQQGCTRAGERGLEAQLAAIRRLRPDIIGLEEMDTARIANGNADLVRWFADRLDMHSYYGPSPVSGTFGVALLSRFPIERPRTFFMPSRGEQTAAIDAWITDGGRKVHVLVTHLDNDGALPQQRIVINRARPGQDSVTVALGDFNFDPATDQYRETVAVLKDAWMAAAKRTVEPGASDPARRIDHVFVSANARVLSADYLPPGPSDHPALFTELGL